MLQLKQQVTAFNGTDLVSQSEGSYFQCDWSTLVTTEPILIRLTFNITRNDIPVGDII
jgi:hypothetical protein